jgi:tetratricopeptide (TPR) repeat protein
MFRLLGLHPGPGFAVAAASPAAISPGAATTSAATCDSLGYIHDQLGDRERSVTCYEQAIDLYQELTDRFNEADTLNHLGDAHQHAGDIQAARATWARAVRILDEIDHAAQ